MLFAAVLELASGTKQTFRARGREPAFGGKADMIARRVDDVDARIAPIFDLVRNLNADLRQCE